MGDINASNSLIVSLMFSRKWFPISFRSLNKALRLAFFQFLPCKGEIPIWAQCQP